MRKLLPSLLLGVAITLLAALFNHLTYDARLPAMATGNRLFANDESQTGERRPGPPFLRVLAGLINLSDDLVTDFMYTIRGAGEFPSTKDRIVLVTIDEASLMRHGSWPWSHRDLARLVEKTAAAKVVGLDMLLHDPDRTSLAGYVKRFDELYDSTLDVSRIDPEELDNDLLLAREISRTRTVLGSAVFDGHPPPARPNNILDNYALAVSSPSSPSVDPSEVLLKRRRHVMTDLPVIRRNTPRPEGEGFANLFHIPNGVLRGIPLFAHVDSEAFARPHPSRRRIYPGFPLEIMRVALGGDGYRLELRGDVVHIPEFRDDASDGNLHAVSGVAVTRREGDGGERDLLRIPLNELGEMEVGFRNHRGDYLTLPAWEVMAGMHDDAFADKLVIIGGEAEGVGAIAGASLAGSNLSVAEAHAMMLSIMLKGDFMDSGYQDDFFWQQVAILASGLAVTLAIIFGDLAVGMLVSSLVLVGCVVGNYFIFFRRGMDVGVTLPVISTLAVLALQMGTNYLVVGRERRFIRRAFSLNVSPSIMNYLETHPDRLSSLQGEHRDMTVLFTDIRGFTSISERMTAPDLARFLNEYFTPMSDIVMQNMGTVDKFIGDGLMAFWNAPADNPHHARDAACAALDMVARLDTLQAGWTGRGLPTIAIGCGINSGPMFAGYMGSDQRKNYTVMGDNVNIASRLENLNKLYFSSILITESTRNALGNDFVCRVVDKVRVSGKVSSLVTYELLGRGPASEEMAEEIAAFARVFQLYQEREFSTAESLLKELVFIRPTPLYEMYLDRLAIYKALPPPDDWDGTFAMTTK